jgi:hypothetical protein
MSWQSLMKKRFSLPSLQENSFSRFQSQSVVLARAGYHCSFMRLFFTLEEVKGCWIIRIYPSRFVSVAWVVFGPASVVDFGLPRSQEIFSSYTVPKKPLMQLKSAPKPAHTTNPINSHLSPSPCLYHFPCHHLHSLPHCHDFDHSQQPSSQTLLPLQYHFPSRPREIHQS